LDVSGSMEGGKLQNCKLAVKEVIAGLSLDDKLHFITYSTTAKCVFENANLEDKESLGNIVDKLKSDANTNMEVGLQLGFETLKKNTTQGSNRIFIFSDGEVNAGETSESGLCNLVKSYQEQGVNTTSFGIGEGFNQSLMKGLAEHGKGLYFFIDKPESVVQLVNKAFDGILGLIGSNAIFKVRGEKGTIIQRVYGHPDLLRGASLSDLTEDDVINVLVQLDVTPQATGDSQPILKYELKYQHVNPNDVNSNKGDKVLRGTISMKCTDDEEKALVENEEVAAALVLAQTAEKEKSIGNFIRDGDIEAAIEMKKDVIDCLLQVVDGDSSGMIGLALTRAQTMLENLQSDMDTALLEKDADYMEYQCGIVHRKCF